MRRIFKVGGLFIVTAVYSGLSGAPVAADTSINANACSIAAGGNANHNTQICNFGLTPQQLRQVTQGAVDGAVEGATGPLLDRLGTISQQLGVTKDATRTLLQVVGEQTDVPDDKLAALLTKVADDYKHLQAQVAALNPDNPVAGDLVAKAKVAITNGQFALARVLLSQATQTQISAGQQALALLHAAQQAADAQFLGAAASTAAEGDLAKTELDYLQAADFYKQAAALVPANSSQVATDYLSRRADALLSQGDERGDNDALHQAIDAYRSIANSEPRDRVPLDWAWAEDNLGIALSALGWRESDTADLQAAVDAYRLALLENTRDRVPLEWAVTENNLGIALDELGQRESGTVDLQAAVDAFHAALQEWTRDRVPLEWAETENNLGNTLDDLGRQESGTADLQAAVAADHAALQELTRDRVPLEWARAETTLGTALINLGLRESGTVDLQAAVDAFHAALQEWTHDRMPFYWAQVERNLGFAFLSLGQRESGTVDLQAAVDAFHAALQEWTRDRVPLEWAAMENNLGIAEALEAKRKNVTQQ